MKKQREMKTWCMDTSCSQGRTQHWRARSWVRGQSRVFREYAWQKEADL